MPWVTPARPILGQVIWRRSKSESPPPPEWEARFGAAASLLRTNVSAPWVEDRVAQVRQALLEADADEATLAASIEQLRPEATSRELKDALRQQQLAGALADPASEARVRSLRERFDAVNGLLNRREELAAKKANALADFEVLAVRAIDVSSGSGEPTDDGDPLAEHLERLGDDLAALRAAHDELRSR